MRGPVSLFQVRHPRVSPLEPATVSEVRQRLAEAEGDSLRAIIEAFATDPRSGVRRLVEQARRRQELALAEQERLRCLYLTESSLRRDGFCVVAGVDEAGRGALAGPITAGACVLPAAPLIEWLDDSKRLAPARRAVVAERIRENAICWSVAHVDASTIDRVGMTAALRQVMRAALGALDLEPDHTLVDGLPVGVAQVETAVVGGDRCVAAIAAASVLAKTERDALMERLDQHHPGYGFRANKGYGTAVHLAALESLGPSPVHRRTFQPVLGTGTLF